MARRDQAARIYDPVMHPMPPVLTSGPGSPDVLINKMKAWRGVGAAAAKAISAGKKAADKAVTAAENATRAAAGPQAAAAKAAELAVKQAAKAAMMALISGAGAGADKHSCTLHGLGVVIDGSQTVLINGLPACRKGDTIIEASGPANKIKKGESSVIIGG